MSLLDKIPLLPVAVVAIVLALIPVGEPHLWEKLNMLMQGSLTKPIDMVDLVWHSVFIFVLLLKLIRMASVKKTT